MRDLDGVATFLEVIHILMSFNSFLEKEMVQQDC